VRSNRCAQARIGHELQLVLRFACVRHGSLSQMLRMVLTLNGQRDRHEQRRVL